MEEKIKYILSSVGFNNNEIIIYLDLLKQKKSSILEISKRTKIHRSTVYEGVQRLIEKGFIKEIIEEKKKWFKVQNPEKIEDYFKQKEQELKEILPSLMQIHAQEEENKEEIIISKGIFGVREALMDLLENTKIINVFGSSQEAVDVLGLGFLKEFHDKRIKKDILMRHIFSQEAGARAVELSKIKLTETKCFPKKYYSIVSTNICEDRVLLIVFGTIVSGILIKNKNIADSYNKYFEILWSKARSCGIFENLP